MSARAGTGRLESQPIQLETKTIAVKPLTPVAGAEVEGLDLSRPLSHEQFEEVRAAFNAYHVLVFRDQHLSDEDHKRFGRMFGRLHVHPYNDKKIAPEHAQKAPLGYEAADPELLIVRANQKSKFVAGEEWHADVTCDEAPPFGSMLYITETPEIGGGDTCFLSAIRAYEALSPAMQRFLEGLTAVHDGAKPYIGAYGTPAPEGGWPKHIHPVVIRHPETQEKVLYVNRGFTTRIVELTRRESDGLLEMLWRHLESQLEFQCRVRWTPGTLVFWDNMAVQHHAVWDYFPYSRFGKRVSIVGAKPQA